MEQIGDMKFVDFEEILERDLGKIGTPKRDEFERKVDETVKKELSIAELFAEREGKNRTLHGPSWIIRSHRHCFK